MIPHELLGIIAGLLAFAANPVYVWSILKGKTKPDRVTWWIIAGLNALITATSFELGARSTIWLPVAYTISFTIIAILSVWYGEGGRASLTTLQKWCVAAALGSVILWWLSGSALLTLVLTIIIDFAGILPTIYKSFLWPEHEDGTAWTIATVASIVNIIAIDSWMFGIYIYPVYVFVTNALITIFIFRKRLP